MHFSIDWLALITATIFSALFFFLHKSLKRKENPSILFPNLSHFKTHGFGIRSSLIGLPRSLKLFALLFFLLAFIDPHTNIFIDEGAKIQPIAKEGTAIFFVLDRSGSMSRKIVYTEGEDKISFESKLDVLKDVTQNFIERRPADLIGLVAFARTAQIIAPLTLNHESIINTLQNLKVVTDKEQDGTALGYAIFKTASIIASTKHFAQEPFPLSLPTYTIKGSAIILITDGFQSPHPEDKGKRLRTMGIEEAAAFAKSQNIRLYIISIDMAMNSPEYEPYRNLLKQSAEKTGGLLYTSDNAENIELIYSQIDQIEKSIVPTIIPPVVEALPPIRGTSYYTYLIIIALLLLFSAIFLETLILRRVP